MSIQICEAPDYYIDMDYPHYVYDKDGKVAKSYERQGYIRYKLKVDGKWHYLSHHRLIYNYLVEEIPEGYEIDHIDNDRQNNCIDNLRCVTRSQNAINRLTKGRGEFVYIDDDSSLIELDEDIYFDTNNCKCYRYITNNKYLVLTQQKNSTRSIQIQYSKNKKTKNINIYDLLQMYKKGIRD